jgi:ribosomal-protein-alanine N-acetyltransferase
MADTRTLRLSLARRRDASAIARLSRELIEVGLPPAWTAERVLRRILDREAVALVARRGDGVIAGFAIMRFGDTVAHLDLLAVDARFQRRGVGHSLLKWLEASARTAGTFDVRLELRADNPQALQFYMRSGFKVVGRVASYYRRQGSSLDAIRMQRDLRIAP